MRIPEGSEEKDFGGRRLVAGRLGDLELYVSWVWGGVRHTYVVGAVRISPSKPAILRNGCWFRWFKWAVAA